MDNRTLRRWASIAIGILLSAVLFLGPNFISPGLGCFIAFLIGAATFTWEQFTKPNHDFARLAHAAKAALSEGYWMIAESKAREALALAAKLRTKQTEATLAAGILLTTSLNAMRRWLDACNAAEEILARVPTGRTSHDATALASIHKSHAEALLHLGRFPEATEAARQCIQWAQQGSDTAKLFQHELEADLCRHQGDYRRMLSHLKQLEDLVETSTNPAIQDTLASVWLHQSTAYIDTFQPARAMLLLEKALSRSQSTPIVNGVLLTLKGSTLDDLQRPAEAQSTHHESLRVFEHHMPPDDPRLAYPLLNLADSYARAGDLPAAMPLVSRIQALEPTLDDSERRSYLELRGLIALRSGNPAEAEQILREALRQQEARTNPTHPDLVRILEHLAIALESQGRTEEAAALEARHKAIREAYADVE
ncbi:MAG: tetratricopeptide repeat protein [Acidobacteria bacterium]|nr:tetratricopeptide repeat protein [Acidobacteriota bacterium]